MESTSNLPRMTWTIAGPLVGSRSTIKALDREDGRRKEIRESQERSLTWEGEGERDIGKWKMSLALCLSLVFIDDFVYLVDKKI